MVILFEMILISSTATVLPKTSYIKSIDVFLGMCFILVFAALLEYATVSYLSMNTNQNVDIEKPPTRAANGGAGSGQSAPLYGSKYTNTLFGVSPSNIDKFSRILFPIFFVVC